MCKNEAALIDLKGALTSQPRADKWIRSEIRKHEDRFNYARFLHNNCAYYPVMFDFLSHRIATNGTVIQLVS